MKPLPRGVWLLLAGACGSDPAAVDGAPQGPALVVPAVISLPYVVAGAGESMIEVTVSNPGTAEVGALSWTIDDAGFTATGPERIGAGESAALVVRWAGAAAPTIAAGTLTVDGDAGARTAEVWAVAGDPALPAADFQPVTGAGGVDIGDSAVLGMPTAPFPAASGSWTDDRVHIFVPAGWRERAAQDLVLHFHGHSTTIDATVPGHRYREHARVDPGADILIVDGFDRVIDGSWGGLAHDFAAVVGEAAGPVHTASNEAITEDGFALAGYRVIFWLLGDESTDDHSFTAAERAALDTYLAGGGHLIISGSEVGFDLGGSTAGATWLAGTAGAVYASDDAGVTAVAGTGPLASVAAFGFGGPTAPYAEEFPDTFTATGAGVALLRYSTGAAAAVGIPGRAALVGFPFELIDDAADLAAVVAALIAFVAP